ncbi:MAG: hypothetical protein WC792_05725 [Candidatus Micrarchaeia archaeon]|jgi:hypothetical protein
MQTILFLARFAKRKIFPAPRGSAVRGQTALEYLLIVGAAIFFVLLVTVAAKMVIDAGLLTAQNPIDKYNQTVANATR